MNTKPDLRLVNIPNALFSENPNANAVRNQLIKNQVRISECEQGELETIFFSDENIVLINRQLILSIFNKTNGKIKISDQSKEQLIIVMRYVFLEHARHLPYDIKGQIKELNCRVVGEILPSIMTNATQRINYLDEINNPRKILPLPVNVHKGKQNLSSVTTVLNNS